MTVTNVSQFTSQFLAMSETEFRSLVQTCNAFSYKLCKNIWSHNLPSCSDGDVDVGLNFDINPGDALPRKLLTCFARQLHNINCVGKILDRVQNAQKFAADAMDLEEQKFLDLGEDFFVSAKKHAIMLHKCEEAMKKRFSIKHRIVDINPDKIDCWALVDIQLPFMGISLSSTENYKLVDNFDSQIWKVQNEKGDILDIPPMLLAVDPTDAELVKIQSVRKNLSNAIGTIQIKFQKQIVEVSKTIISQKETVKVLIDGTGTSSSEMYFSGLNTVSKCCNSALEDERRFNQSEVTSQQEIISKLLSVHTALLQKLDKVEDSFVRFTKLQKFLTIYLLCLNYQITVLKLGFKQNGKRLGNISRSVSFSNLHRRTSFFEFAFEFEEKTRKSTASHIEPQSDLSTSESDSIYGETETVTRSRQEVKRRFVITAVWDGHDDIPLQDAINRKIIVFERGTYFDNDLKDEIPIEAAMSMNKINVEYVSSKKVSEDVNSYGIINVRDVICADKPFTIKSVMHPQSKKWITLAVAIAEGIINMEHSLYRDPETKTDKQLLHAVEEGLVQIEADETELNSPNVAVTSYVIHGVVDHKQRKKVTFREACELGLVDRETGAFINRVTGERTYPLEAIRRGFYKSYPVDNPSLLTINPENRITVSHFNKLKNKLSAVMAFAKTESAKG